MLNESDVHPGCVFTCSCGGIEVTDKAAAGQVFDTKLIQQLSKEVSLMSLALYFALRDDDVDELNNDANNFKKFIQSHWNSEFPMMHTYHSHQDLDPSKANEFMIKVDKIIQEVRMYEKKIRPDETLNYRFLQVLELVRKYNERPKAYLRMNATCKTGRITNCIHNPYIVSV